MVINLENLTQIAHVVRLEVLAGAARSAAVAEFENPEIQAVRVTVFRHLGPELLPVEIESFGANDVPMGGVSL